MIMFVGQESLAVPRKVCLIVYSLEALKARVKRNKSPLLVAQDFFPVQWFHAGNTRICETKAS